jgi:hypothetical protein
MGGTGSRGGRQGAGRKSKQAVAAESLGRSQTSMRAFTTRDPQRVAQEAAEREQAQAKAQAMAVTAQAVAIQQKENMERKRLDAIKILKQVMDEGNLVETDLESLPDNDNDDDNDDENRKEYDEDEDEDDADDNSMRRSTAY